MAGDIRVGDVVVCVDDRPSRQWPDVPLQLHKGAYYRVTETSGLGEGVRVAGIVLPLPDDWFAAHRFRKLNDEPDNAELVERIRKCKPTKVSEHV